MTELISVLEAGIPPYVARPIPSANQQRGLFSQEDFTSDSATDTYQCPAGARLICRFATGELVLQRDFPNAG